jgi:hypothetical protein
VSAEGIHASKVFCGRGSRDYDGWMSCVRCTSRTGRRCPAWQCRPLPVGSLGVVGTGSFDVTVDADGYLTIHGSQIVDASQRMSV